MGDERREHLVRFYSLLDSLQKAIGGARTLAASSARMDWPKKDVYFFRESGELRVAHRSGSQAVS